MKNKKIGYTLCSVFLIVGILLSGCSYKAPSEQAAQTAAGSATPNGGNPTQSGADEIKVGLDLDAGTMDSRLARDTTAVRSAELIYDGLIVLSNKLEPQPALAEKWENPDPTTWIFTLRKGVTFHDGQPFTAEDVKYTFESLLDTAFKAPNVALYAPISKIEVVNELTVKFTLKQPYAPLLSYMDIGIVPKHIGEKKDGSLAAQPIGTGPYKMIKWDKNSKISFEAYDKYWGGPAKTKKVTYFIIPDNTTRVAALESKDIDLVHSPLSPQDIKKMKDKKEFTVIETQGLGFTYLNFNTTNPILSDVKVRQALAYLVNKKAISEDLYQGMDKPGKSPLIPPSWAYTDSIAGYPFDVNKAKDLFAEAGWKDTNGDGVLDKNGAKLTLTLSTHTEDPNRMQAVEFLQNEFKKAGIDVKVSTTEFATLNTNLLSQKFDIALLGWLNLTDPDRAMYDKFNSKSGNNFGKYSNPKVDELLEKGRTTLDQKQRVTIYQEAAKIVTEEVAYDVLLYQGYFAIFNNNVSGFVPYPKGSMYSLKDVVIKK